MKKNFGLIVFMVTIACFVLAVGFAGLAGDAAFEKFGQNISKKYSNEDELKTRTTELTFAAEKLSDVQVEATAQDLRIEKSPDNEIHLQYTYRATAVEKSPTQLKNEVAKIDGAAIKFSLGEAASEEKNVRVNLVKLFNFGVAVNDSKVTLKIPANITSLKLVTVSGDIRLMDVKLNAAAIETVSGDVIFKGEQTEIQHKSVSGDLKAEGEVKKLRSETVSGELTLRTTVGAPSIDYNSTSGDARIYFQNVKPDVSVNFKTTSGDVRLPGKGAIAIEEGGLENMKLGNGQGIIRVENISGDLRISD